MSFIHITLYTLLTNISAQYYLSLSPLSCFPSPSPPPLPLLPPSPLSFSFQDDHSETLLVANGFPGIKIFSEKNEIHHFQWPHIVKVSYKRRKFRIKYHPVDSYGTVSVLRLSLVVSRAGFISGAGQGDFCPPMKFSVPPSGIG